MVGFSQETLPTLQVDISDNDIPAADEKIADEIKTSGGLYLND